MGHDSGRIHTVAFEQCSKHAVEGPQIRRSLVYYAVIIIVAFGPTGTAVVASILRTCFMSRFLLKYSLFNFCPILFNHYSRLRSSEPRRATSSILGIQLRQAYRMFMLTKVILRRPVVKAGYYRSAVAVAGWQ